MCDLSDSSYGKLEFEHVARLKSILEEKLVFDSASPQFSSVRLRPIDLLVAVREQWSREKDSPPLHEVRLNGSAATCVVSEGLQGAGPVEFNDLDLIFRVDIDSHSDFQRIREIAMAAFLLAAKRTGADQLPEHPFQVEDCYVRNMMKIWNSSDRWSLISFRNRQVGRDIELKFVAACKRPYQFSIDSFQLCLDSYLSFWNERTCCLSPRFFPTVVVHSVWGNYWEALRHVKDRLIATENPASIYGGGLLKYCHLLTTGYRSDSSFCREKMESIMCTRFFIDFPDGEAVQTRIVKYVNAHFQLRPPLWANLTASFLRHLLYVVDRSSRCCLTLQDRQERLSCLQYLVRPPPERLPMRHPRRSHNQHALRARSHCPPPAVRKAHLRASFSKSPCPRSTPLVSECA